MAFKRGFPILLCLSGAACATAPRVSDSDLGRLTLDQIAPVQQAQQARDAARQLRNEASRDVDAARERLNVARPQKLEAEARVETKEANLKIAKAAGDPAQIQLRTAELTDAEGLLARNKAFIHWRQKQLDEQQVAFEVADAQLEVEKAKVERAKWVALQQANNPASNKYDGLAFQRQVDDRVSDKAQADVRLADAHRDVDDALARWQQLGGVVTPPMTGAPPPDSAPAPPPTNTGP